MTQIADSAEAKVVTLGEMWQWLRERKRFIVVVTAACTLAALLVALFATPRYRATIMLAPPASAVDGGALQGLAGQFGGLAGLAGLELGDAQDLDQTLVILQSRAFLEKFIAEEGVLQELYARRWDAASGKWKADESPGGRLRAGLSAILARLSGDEAAAGSAADGRPDLWAAYRRFSSLMDVFKDKRTQIVTLTVDWKNPVVAARWANGLPQRLNRQMRERAQAESARSLEYLQRELARTDMVEVREALFRLIEAEQKRAMAASVREEYAVRVLTEAPVPRERVFPKRSLLVLGGMLLGLLAACFWVVAAHLVGGKAPESAEPV